MKPYHRPTILQDVVELAPVLRPEDVREVALHGHTPEQALCIGYLSGSLTRSVINNYGQVVGMYGVVRISDISGRIWMLGSKGLLKISRPFLKESKSEVENMHKLFPNLTNYIDSRNAVHVRWVRWLGFKFLGETVINNVKLYEFSRLSDNAI